MNPDVWLELYYPVHASSATGSDREALDHSVRKWQGLSSFPEAGVAALDSRGGVTSQTCALCHRNAVKRDVVCNACPLFKMRGGYACDDPTPEEVVSPYGRWASHRDALTMLEQLIVAESFCQEATA